MNTSLTMRGRRVTAAPAGALRLRTRNLLTGWYGGEYVCFTPFPSKNLWKSSFLNCGPPSVTQCNGSPKRENSFLNSLINLYAFAFELKFIISGYFEWASTMINHIDPWNGPAKLQWIRLHALLGHGHIVNGVCADFFLQLVLTFYYTNFFVFRHFFRIIGPISRNLFDCHRN